ncbi:MAG: hypothetical protein AAF291_15645 [Pseudomonadota bacterium]
MSAKADFLVWWLAGLAIFAISLALHAPLAIDAVPGGILDHQAAPDAARVNAIQQAWQAAGVLDQARIAMAVDLLFIVVYSFGALKGGRYYRRWPGARLTALGWSATVAGSLFFVTDFIETLLQFYQALRFEGSDTLAAIASSMGPVKMVSFLASVGVLIIALVWERYAKGVRPS